jgi:hypothetical protein
MLTVAFQGRMAVSQPSIRSEGWRVPPRPNPVRPTPWAYDGVPGEGSIPVPLPPPDWPKPCILRADLLAIKPSSSTDFLIGAPNSQSAKPAHFSPNDPFLSEALDSEDSVRFSKFKRFEELMKFNEERFWNSPRTGDSNRFRIRQIKVRILPPSQAFMRSARLLKKYENGPEIRLFAHSISSPTTSSTILKWKSPKISGLVREYSRFAETNGGDWYDHDCRPMNAVDFAHCCGRHTYRSAHRRPHRQRHTSIRYPLSANRLWQRPSVTMRLGIDACIRQRGPTRY